METCDAVSSYTTIDLCLPNFEVELIFFTSSHAHPNIRRKTWVKVRGASWKYLHTSGMLLWFTSRHFLFVHWMIWNPLYWLRCPLWAWIYWKKSVKCKLKKMDPPLGFYCIQVWVFWQFSVYGFRCVIESPWVFSHVRFLVFALETPGKQAAAGRVY